MDDEQKRMAWRVSWKNWFNSSESTEVKNILETGRQGTVTEASDVAEYVVHELQCMKKPEQTAIGTDIQKSLGSMTLEELRTHVKGNMANLDHEINKWKANRQSGPKKAARKIEEFAEEFDAFLSGFSGIVEVVKLVDNQYAGAASSVLFILFATAKAKVGNDRSILSSMRLLARRLPDLEIYYQIYANKDLAKLLSKAYADVISFARKATVYFQGNGFARFTKGLGQPKAFAGLEQEMARNFKEIRLQCNTLLSERIFYLSEQNTDLMEQVERLRETIQALHKRKDEDAAHVFRKSLLSRSQSEPTPKRIRDDELAEYGKFLEMVFQEYNTDLTAMTLADLQKTPEYRFWDEADASMLVLYGRNHHDCTAPQSWLSSAAVNHTLDLMSRGTDSIVAHVMGKELGPQEALAAIADQLVEQQPQVLRRSSAVGNISFQAEDLTLQGRGRTVASIIDRCTCPIYILIDRLDQCCGEETWATMKLLVDLVKLTRARLKILLVLRMDLWNIEERLDLVDESSVQSKKLILLRKHQEELPDR